MRTGGTVRAIWRTLSTPSLIVKVLQSLAGFVRREINLRVSRRIIRKRGLSVIDTPNLLANKHKWDLRMLGASEELDVPMPVRVQPPTAFDGQYAGRFRIGPPWALILPDATVSGPLSTVISSKGEIILESQSTSNNRTSWAVPSVALRRWKPGGQGDPMGEAGATVPLAGYWATGYFHWMGEHLPRLALLPSLQEELGTVRLIVPRNPPAWLVDSLALLGYSPDDLLFWPSPGHVRCRKIIVLSSPRFTPTGKFSVLLPSMLRFVRKRLSPPRNAVPNRRLYITRASSPGRNVSNEDEVRATLEARGFETVDPGQLSLRDQIEAFAAAQVVAGPHGAGLTNIMFSRGADVIELHEADRPKTASFRLIAAAAGHRYGALTCTALKTLHPRRPNLHVDTSSLGRLVDVMDESRSCH